MSGSDDELRARAEERVGTVLRGKYRIDSVLGVGGMAAVYAATHRNGRRVAVKMLHPELSARSDLRERFVRESHAANAVGHPGVVVVIDDDVAEDGSVFLVMELLVGESVEEMWERNGQVLQAPTVLAIARELCDVLAAAHRAGVVHRDVKPANLFLTEDDRLKVLDFGIARARGIASTNLTDTGMLLGTPAFMAPEQASGRASRVDARTDVWAVGATMFALLSGRAVHEGETAQHVVMLAATQAPRSLASVTPEIAPEIVALVDKALELDPSKRWPSADSMRSAIEAVSRSVCGDALIPLQRLSETIQVTAVFGEGPIAGASQKTEPLETPAPSPGPPGPRIRVLGSTTSTPVSSTGPTKPRHPAWRPTLRMAPFVRTIASALTRLRIPSGTANGGQATADAPAPPRRPPSLSAVVVLVVAALAATVAAFVVGSRAMPFQAAPSALPTPVPMDAGTTATPPADGAGAAASPADDARMDDAVADEGLDVNEGEPTVTDAAPRRKIRPRRPPARPSPAPAPPAPSPAAKPRDCNPPYRFNEWGKKIWKPGCFR